MRLKQISQIRKVVKGLELSNRDKCTIEVFDYTEVSLHDKNRSTTSEENAKLTIVSAILKKRQKKNQTEKKIDNTLFVFWLESYQSLIKDLLLSKTSQLENLGFMYAQNSDRTSKTILKNELWSLYHDKSVICSSWKKNYGLPTQINKLFLVTLTKYYMAYIWRFNELQDSFEICIQIPLQNDNYTLNFHCLWMNVESVVSDYNFSKRAFLIFYNTTNTRCYSISTEDLESDFPYNHELKSGDSDIFLPNLNTDDDYSVGSQDYDQSESLEECYDDTGEEYDNILFHKYEDYVQYFEIYGVDGLFNHRLAVTSEYLLGSNELTMPVKIKLIESVCICDHTFETGLVTLYTSDSLRPNKITTKSPIVVSKWITLKSTNLSNFYKSNSNHNLSSVNSKNINPNVSGNINGNMKKSDESLDELIGMQISKGLNKILPPVKFILLNENDIRMDLLLSPYDLFLKDDHIRESVDNIVGLVIRYMFHPSTPLYINVNNELVYIENYFINRIKESTKVKNIKVFSGKNETLYIIHSKTGALTAITSKKHDPNDITHHQIHNMNHVISFQVIEYHHQLYFIIFTPYDKESVLLTQYDNESVLLTPYHNDSVILTPYDRESLCKNFSDHARNEYAQNDGSLYVCGFYKWENYKLNLKGSWLFQRPDPSKYSDEPNGVYDDFDDAIIQFKKWYDSNYFCLLSKFKLISPNDPNITEELDDTEVVYLYMIKSHKIIKWLEITSKYCYDLLTQDKYLLETSGRNDYMIEDLKILIKSRPMRDMYIGESEYQNEPSSDSLENSSTTYSDDVVGELPLFTGCNFENKMFPVYHPECVLTMFKLGLNTLVSKLVNMLVFLFRRILSQLKDNIYCTNSNPYNSEEQSAVLTEDVSGGCNCIIFKTLALKLFCRFNRFFYDYIIKTIYTSNMTHGQNFEENKDAEEPKKTILNDYVVDDEYNQYFKDYCSFRVENEFYLNELIVYLQVLRLIGLSWYEQYQLINILTKYLSTSDDMLLFNSNRDLENIIGSMESTRDEDGDEDLCNLCQNSNILLRIGMEQNSQVVTPDHNILKYLISYMTSLSPSFFSTFPTNKNLTDLDNVFFTKYKEHLDDKFKVNQHIFKDESVTLTRDEDAEENFLIWLLLVKNDHNLLIELDHYYTNTIVTGDSGLSYTEYMDMINVGYWVKNKTTFKYMFENVEKCFRLKVKTYRNIEDFDQFGFYLILQGKVKIFSLLLKSKGFEKFANFLTNDFTQERWKDASVKNAFALISQRRYLLSSAMLILANRIQDAVDVVHQYLNNLSLSILISKLFNFSLQYTFNKIQNKKIKYILLHTHSIDTSPEYSSDNINTLAGSNAKDQDSGRINTQRKEGLKKNLHVEDPLSKQVELLCHNDDSESDHPYDTNMYNTTYTKHSYSNMYNTPYPKHSYNSVYNTMYLKNPHSVGLNEEARGYNMIGHDLRILDLLSGTVDELILNVSIGIVLKKLDMLDVEQMIRNSSRYYLDKMPMISALLHSFVVNYTSWDKILIYASNFLHFQKFNNFNQKYDYLDYTNQGLNDSYCNSNYYVDDYKYLDGNVLVEFNNYTFKQTHMKCPILKKLSSIISTKHLPRPKGTHTQNSQHTLFSFSTPNLGHLSGSTLDDQNEFVRSGDEIFVMNEETDLVVNVNTLSVVEVLLKIKSTLNMELTLNYYKINSIISIRKYDIDIESIYTRLVNTFIGFLDSNLSIQEFNIPSLQLNLINKLALLAIHSSNLDNSNENQCGTLESDYQSDNEVKDRLDVGLYDSDLNLVNEEIVCVCFVVSLTCVFILVLYKVGLLPQVYNGLYTQLTLLNQMKGNNEWLKQFLESVINTIEPSLFANDTFDVEKFNILSTSSNINTKTQLDDELQLKEFIGIIITLSMVETILGLMRNYIYKQTNYYHYFWLDRLSVSMSKYLFNYRDHLIKLSLKSSKTLYRLNYNYHNPEDSEGSNYKNTNKYSDHVDIVNNYVLSNFNNSFYKLWSYLNCNYKLYSLYSNNCNISPYLNNASPSINNALDSDNTPESDSGYFDETDDYNHLYNLLDDYQIINYDNLLIPMILPLKLIFFNLHYYSSHQIYLNNLEETANKDDVDILKKIVDNIRKIRFISLHNAKGRTLSTFYTMSNITMNEHLNHLSLQLLLEPVKSDLYLLTELNTNLCPYQLNKNITTNVLNLLIRYNNLHKQRKLDNKDSDNNWVILLRLIRYLSSYSKSYVEEAFNIRQDHFELSEKLQMLLKIKDSNNSGGIQPHPILPIYAIAHGSSNDKSQPSYSVSLQHTSTLAKEFMFTKNEILLNNLINIYNVSTLQLTTFHSSNLFGDLLSIYWSGDSLCLYDKFGWIMIYYMKNLLYLNNVPSKNGKSEKDHVPNSIPTICFKTHLTSNYMSWLGEYYVLTLGNGILEESIERDIIFINLTLLNSQKESNSQEQESTLQENERNLENQTNLQEESNFQEPKESNFQEQHDTNSFDTTSTDFNVSNTDPNPENSDVEVLDNSELKSVGRDVISSKGLKMFSENNVPCICIWNLVEYSNNNIPKIKILMSFVHPDNKETKEKDELPKVTSILPIKNDTVTNGSKEVQLEYDLLLFDSMGVLRVFSVTDMDIVFTHALENTAIIAAFMLLNGNIVTVTEDSKIKVYKLMSLYTKPQLIFDTVSIVKQPRSVVSSSSFVSSIGEFISQKFSREKPQQPQQPLKVINVKLYSRQFIAIVYSDEQVSTTQLPNFAVY